MSDQSVVFGIADDGGAVVTRCHGMVKGYCMGRFRGRCGIGAGIAPTLHTLNIKRYPSLTTTACQAMNAKPAKSCAIG